MPKNLTSRMAPGGPEREIYLIREMQDAAHSLRNGKPAALIATNLEDALSWTTDPETCSHPYQDARRSGKTNCRTCGRDTTEDEGMGY